MKRHEENIDEAFKTLLPSATPQQTEAAAARVLQQLRLEGDHSIEAASLPPSQQHWRLLAAAAVVFAVLGSVVMVKSFLSQRQARVETAGGGLYLISGERLQALPSGRTIEAGEILRTYDGSSAVLVLSDGSRVEMQTQSELLLEPADDGVRIRLNKGGILVNAARQRTGRLYVQTKDVIVSVVGTVFLVKSEERGSRVAVIEGEVRVQQGATSKELRPGEQLATNPQMQPLAVKEEVAWSRSAPEHLALLQQSTAIESRRLKFEAASIKPEMPFSNGGVSSSQLPCRGVDGEFGSRIAGSSAAGTPAPLGRCAGRYVPLSSIIAAAYGPGVLVEGVPNWGPWPNGYFQIDAKAEDPASTTMEQLRQMLQTMLEDRFKLRIHHETREFPGYVLLVARSGLKAREFAGPEETLIRRDFNDGGGAGGVRGAGSPGSRRVRIAGKSSTKEFAAVLSLCGVAGRPVMDKTELAGNYDFNLMLVPIPVSPGMSPEEVERRMCSPEFDTSLSRALEDQLGFRMEEQKVLRDVIVVEYAEKPSDN